MTAQSLMETAQDKLLELKARKTNENVIHERPQDIEYEQPQPMSKLRKLSDTGMDCQGGGMRDAKRRKLDVSLTDGPTLKTIFVNAPSRNFQHINTYKQSDQDYSDEVNTAVPQATEGRNDMISFERESSPIVMS